MKTTLFIPEKLKIGYQKRTGTFTGKLAYVIYYDEKNKLRKEKSWENWRDKSIEPIEIDNNPRNGFILNKGIDRYSDWGSGRSIIRVYSPDDFEFEITIDNLIGILMHSDISKRDINEACVFAWQGTELVLLPINSVEYQQSLAYTEKQSQKVSAKDLIRGCRYYKKKDNEVLIYIGFYDWWKHKRKYVRYENNQHIAENIGKRHIFAYQRGSKYYFDYVSMSVLSSIVSDDVVDNYAELVDQFFASKNSQPIKGFKIDQSSTVIEQDTYDPTSKRFPAMFEIQGNRIRQISVSIGTLRRDPASGAMYRDSIFSGRQILESATLVELTNNSSMFNTVTWKRSKSSYYYGDDVTHHDITIEFMSTLKPILGKYGYNIDTLTPEQYVEVMTELGFGQVRVILSNNQETDYKDYIN